VSLIAALLLVATPALAGRGEVGEKEVGIYAGYAWLDNYRTLQPKDDVLFGVRFGYFFSPLISVEGSLQRLSTDSEFDAGLGLKDVGVDNTSLRVNVLWNLFPDAAIRPFLTAGFGAERLDADKVGDSTDLGLNAGGGARFFIGDSFGIRLEGRYIYVDTGDAIRQAQKNFEGTLGGFYAFGGGPAPDADKDGVPDRKDKCPNTPAGAKVDLTGCPTDADGDGVFDGIDQCPDTPKGWPVDEKGCPKDTDGDGVADGADTCPDTPKGAKVDAKGCPSDSDGDGVFDGVDQCPDTPKGAKVDAKGCPLDGDKDGVFDGLDACPDSKPGVKVDEKGCEIIPKAPPLFEMEKKSLVLEGVNFEVDKADLLPESLQVLDKVALSLHDWPEVRVEVGGHTDASGSSSHNLELSQKRAEAVKAYLVSKGIDASRMTAKGYGKTRPIADNNTKEGKAKNRRVELTKLD
jgi:outer membrane protein OmpA-like peptidoglycan-associated protein/opacity protein-like surface antigen